jgi:cell division protein FtsQ
MDRFLRWGSATALLGGLAGGAIWAAMWLGAADNVPLERVRIDGDIRHTKRAVLERTLAKGLRGSFFSLDLNTVRRALEDLPWVTRASVRRVWPATLVVRVEERRALARWGEDGVISPEGEVFTPDPDSLPKRLAILAGPLDSATNIAKRYGWLRQRLSAREMEIARLQMSDRHAWILELRDGPRLYFGNRDFEPRFERFLKHYPRLAAQGAVEQMDFRYANGFAVRWASRQEDSERRDMGVGG